MSRSAFIGVAVAIVSVLCMAVDARAQIPNAPVNPDDPGAAGAAGAAADDPTRPDEALRNILGAQDRARRPAPPAIRLRGLIAVGARAPAVVVSVGDAFVRLQEGKEWTAANGAELAVAELTPERAQIAIPADRLLVDVELGAVAPASPDQKRITRLDLRELPLTEVCRLIADETGSNVVPSQGAGTVSVSLYLRNVDVTSAIRTLCETHRLWFLAEPSGLLRVSTVDEYNRDLTDIQEERTEVFTLNYPNVFDVGHAIEDLFGDRVEMRLTEGSDDERDDLSDRLSRFDLFDARTQGFGQSFGGTRGGGYGGGYGGGAAGGYGAYGVDSGYGNNEYGNTDSEDYDAAGGRGRAAGEERDSVRGTLSSEEIARLEDLLARSEGGAADAANLAKEVARQYVAPIYVTGASRQNKLVVRTSDASAMEQIRQVVAELDVPTALVLLEIRILAIQLEDGFESFFEYQWGNSGDNLQGSFADGNIAGPTSGLGPGGTGLRSGDLIFQYVDEHFAARLQALESESRTRTVATPILLTANNEVSRLFIGREVPLNRSFEGGDTLVNESTTTATTGSTNIEFRPVGTTLLVTPNINADRSVSLRIVQENSNVNSTATVLVPAGSTFVPQEVDVVSSQSVSGTIVARDNLAVAFGGMIERQSSRDSEGVPYLRDIPWLGVLFERNTDKDTHNEVVIVVKPYVIGTPADFASVPAKTLADLGVDLDAFHTNPTTGEVLSPQGPFTNPRRFRVHGIDRPDLDGAGVSK